MTTVAAIGLTVAGCSSAATAPNRTTSAATKPASTSAVATSTQPPSPREQLRTWYIGVSADFDVITTDLGNISKAAGAYDLRGIHAACGALKVDTQQVIADPPAPDPAVRRDTALAMNLFSTAASECVNGDFQDTTTDETQGTKYLNAATQHINSLH